MNEPSDPLQGLLGDLLKMIGGAPGTGGVPWLESARALARGVATDNQPATNPDPLRRIRLEEVGRVAELHVQAATGLAPGTGGRPVRFDAVGRATMADRFLDAWLPHVRRMVEAQQAAGTTIPGLEGLAELGRPDALGGTGGADDANGLGEILSRFAATMGPVLLGMQFGSAAGHLARRALGQHALPMPWPAGDEILVVPENVDAFVEDWSLPAQEADLFVCVRELTAHAVLSLPHVAGRLDELLVVSTLDTVAVQQGLAEQLGAHGEPDVLQRLMSDPESIFADLLTPAQQRSSATLTAVVTAVGAYVDHMTARIADGLTASGPALREAWYRFRVEDARGEQAAGSLFGLDLGREQVDRGAAFVRGVLERAGDEGLSRLWTSARTLPTPAELDAPGLWLERIDLPDPELPDAS
jgi:putative hydrolase